MTDLLERKTILENKIRLNKYLMEEKHKEFNYHRHEAERLQFVIENLHSLNVDDNIALDKIENEIASEIPTLALHNQLTTA